MKVLNWIKFISVFLIALASVIIVVVFYSANKPLASAKVTAKDAAIESGEVVSVKTVQSYNGTVALSTVFGTNKDGVEIALFVDDAMKGNYESVKLADGITADEAIKTVKKELDVKKLLHVTLGLEEGNPVWEVVYTSDNDKLNYVYVLFENGQWWKRILNL